MANRTMITINADRDRKIERQLIELLRRNNGKMLINALSAQMPCDAPTLRTTLLTLSSRGTIEINRFKHGHAVTLIEGGKGR